MTRRIDSQTRRSMSPVVYVLFGSLLTLLACVIAAAPLWHRMVAP
jgi:hypothetical protein